MSFSAFVQAEYTDKYLSSSMRLMLLERAYDAGVGDGFKSGKKLTTDQVSAIQSSVQRSENTISSVSSRLNEIQLADIQTAKSADIVLDEAKKIRQESIDSSNTYISTSRTVLEQANKIANEKINIASEKATLISDANKLTDSSNMLWDVAASLKTASDNTEENTQNAREALHNLKTESEKLKLAENVYQKSLVVSKNATKQANKQIYLASAEADKITKKAKIKAKRIISKAEQAARDRRNNYADVMNTPVDCHMRDVSFESVLHCMAPEGWEIDPQIDNKEILNASYSIDTDKPRRLAIHDFLKYITRESQPRIGSKLDLKAHFYTNRTINGVHKPLIVIEELQ